MKIERGINPNCSELVIRLPGDITAKELFRRLDKVGFDDHYFENATVELRGHSLYGDGPIIMGSQHCCAEMYPLLNAISKEFKAPVEGHDGGSVTEYDDWVSQGCPDPKEWHYE
jgi:hypothetical protein